MINNRKINGYVFLFETEEGLSSALIREIVSANLSDGVKISFFLNPAQTYSPVKRTSYYMEHASLLLPRHIKWWSDEGERLRDLFLEQLRKVDPQAEVLGRKDGILAHSALSPIPLMRKSSRKRRYI